MSLRDAIADGAFFTLPTQGLLACLSADFSSELARLRTAYSIPAQEHRPSSQPSPSRLLFGSEYDEVNRTLVSVEALRKIHNNDYTGLVSSQDPSVRLRRESFDWIRAVYQRAITSPDALYTLVASIIINDLGKSSTLAADLRTVTGRGGDPALTDVNHDALLHCVVTWAPELIPCLAQLTRFGREALELGIAVGASFNFGQLAQAENVPASLVGLDCVRGSPFAFELHFLEQVLDIAGAAGHEDHEHAKKLTEPIFRAYHIVYEVVLDYIRGRGDRRRAYDANLIKRIGAMGGGTQGWDRGQQLHVASAEHRALMRLLCICNASAIERADLVWDTFHGQISADTRSGLVHGLNVDGGVGSPAVQATYIPAVCEMAFSATRSRPASEKRSALDAVFRYLARVLTITAADRASLPPNTAVVERDVRRLALPVVSSAQFREHPEMLDSVELPPCKVAIVFPTAPSPQMGSIGTECSGPGGGSCS